MGPLNQDWSCLGTVHGYFGCAESEVSLNNLSDLVGPTFTQGWAYDSGHADGIDYFLRQSEQTPLDMYYHYRLPLSDAASVIWARSYDFLGHVSF